MKDLIKINEHLYNRFLRRLKNNHLDINARPKSLTDHEVLRFRKIYEQYQGQLVRAGIVAGY